MKEIVALPVDDFRHDVESDAAANVRPRPPNRRAEKRPHFSVGQIPFRGEDTVCHEVVTGDRADVRVQLRNVDLHEPRVGKFRAGAGENQSRTVSADVGDVGEPATADMRQELAAAAAEITERYRRRRLRVDDVEHDVESDAAIGFAGPERAARGVAEKLESAIATFDEHSLAAPVDDVNLASVQEASNVVRAAPSARRRSMFSRRSVAYDRAS
ncbi:MAG: hypothetical protein M3N49_03115 [Candidatus Eremiobacteraeota bacterium]|nr:hypothetical protein [Candidatus Eremiobacteraeota bacterium]